MKDADRLATDPGSQRRAIPTSSGFAPIVSFREGLRIFSSAQSEADQKK